MLSFLFIFFLFYANAYDLELIYTKGRHGRILPVQFGVECSDPNCEGFDNGMSILKEYADTVKLSNPNTLVADLGDSLAGSPWFNLFGLDFMSQVYEELPYDVFSLGYEELPQGVNGLARFLGNVSRVYAVAANLVSTGGVVLPSNFGASFTFFAGEVGVCGVVDDTLLDRIKEHEGLNVTQGMFDALTGCVGALVDLGVNKVVALAPLSFTSESYDVFRAINGLDVVLLEYLPPSDGVDGNVSVVDQVVALPALSGATQLFATTSTFFSRFAHLSVTFDAFGRVSNYTARQLALNSTAYGGSAAMDALVDAYFPRLNASLGRTINEVARFLPYNRTECRSRECLLATYALEAMAHDAGERGAQYDFYALNGGSVAGPLFQGPLALRELYSYLPFASVDVLTRVELTGAQVRAMLEHSVAETRFLPAGDVTGRFLQVKGISFAYNPEERDGQRVFDLRVVGRGAVRAKSTYSFLTIDFISSGRDGYGTGFNTSVGFPESLAVPPAPQPVLLSEALESYTLFLAQQGEEVDPQPLGCIALTARRRDAGGADADDSGGGRSTSGIVAGAVVGGTALIALLFLLLCCAFCGTCLLILLLLCLLVVGACLLAAAAAAAGAGVGGGVLYGRRARARADAGTRDLRAMLDMYMADADYRELERGDLVLKERVGEGNFGEVYRGYWRGAEVAVKTLHAKRVSEDVLAAIRAEARLMKRLGNHPNIVAFLGAVTKESDTYCIVTEFCAHGSLHGVLRERSIPLDDGACLQIALDAARAVAYIHQEGIAHTDIAARNFLVNAHGRVLLSDFGEAVALDPRSGEARMARDMGPVRWMAPESISERRVHRASDAYMYGVFLYELTHRKQPHEGVPSLDVIFGVVRDHLRPALEDGVGAPVLRDLMAQCWRADPKERPEMREVVQRLHAADQQRGGGSIGTASAASSSSFSQQLSNYQRLHSSQPIYQADANSNESTDDGELGGDYNKFYVKF